MAWNGTGTFSRTNGVNTGTTVWAADKAAGVKIVSDRHDTHDQDLADGINACIAKNGENAATANLDLGGFIYTNAGDATADAHLATKGQNEKRISRSVTHDFASDADYTLTSAQEAYGRVIFTDTGTVLTAARNITVASSEFVRVYQNDTLYTLTVKTSAGTGVAVTPGQSARLLCDGTNVIDFYNSKDERSKIQPVTASVAANALTITLNPTVLDFRSATAGSGTVNTRYIDSAISMTVSSGSTLGTVNAVAARLAIIAIDNAGTVELAINNVAGGVNLDETDLLTTTAEGGAGAADSATVVYSTTARTNVPYRVVGYIDITEATAGTWATAPSAIQGAGGNAATSNQSLGYGQTYADVVGSRALGTTYYNTTGKPIWIQVRCSFSATSSVLLTIGGAGASRSDDVTTGLTGGASAIVPPGMSYAATATNGTLVTWYELS